MASKGVLLGINTAKKVLRMTAAGDGQYNPSEVIPYPDPADPATYITVFNLAADLNPGDTVNATVISSTDPALSQYDIISVFDSQYKYRGYTTVGNSSRGVAIYSGDVWHIIQVDQHPLLWYATLTSNTHDFAVSPGSGTPLGDIANQQPITYNDRISRTTYPFGQFPSYDPTVNNPFNHIGKIGDKMLISTNGTNETHFILEIYPAVARQFHFKFTQDRPVGAITAGNQITAEGYQAVTNSTGEIPLTATLRDLYGLAIGSKNGQHGLAVWNFKDAEFDIQMCQHTATVVEGTISAFSGSPATFTTSTLVVGLNGVSPSGPLTVHNRYSWESGTAGHNIVVMWNPVVNQWHPIQMRCPA